MTFGERLKNLRINKNITQIELAKIANINVQTLARYEKNLREPSFEAILKFANFFNVSFDYLFGRTDIEDINENRFNKSTKRISSLEENLNSFIKRTIEDNATYVPKKELENSLKGLISNYIQYLDFEIPHSADYMYLVVKMLNSFQNFIYTSWNLTDNKETKSFTKGDILDFFDAYYKVEHETNESLKLLITLALDEKLDLTLDEEINFEYKTMRK